jgi:hypothetical protein
MNQTGRHELSTNSRTYHVHQWRINIVLCLLGRRCLDPSTPLAALDIICRCIASRCRCGALRLDAHGLKANWSCQLNCPGALTIGGIGFVAGFFGPIVFAPDANQGPLLGIFITGPLGFLFGAATGTICWFVRERHKTQESARNAG